MRAIIIHGTGGSPSGNWFPWLSKNLANHNISCVIPQFPTLEFQSLNSWMKKFKDEFAELNQNDVLIGHSIGAAFVLHLLEQYDAKVRAVFLVSGFIRSLGLTKFDPYNKTFVEHDFNFNKIKNSSAYIKCYLGDNDPYVPDSYSLELSQKLECNNLIIKEGGHLNSEFGYDEFPVLLKDILLLKDSR